MMKKLFTGASAALAGLLLASPAAAQGEAETMMSLGGYSSYTVAFTKHPDGGVAEQEGDIAIFNNTEIFFNGSAETDGGLQISARVELEGHDVDGAGQIDEHYITIAGGFGSVEVGANDGADDRFAKGIRYGSSAVDYWYTNNSVVPGDTGAGAGYRSVGISNDGLGVVYTTPSLGGASFAIGYKPKNGNAVGTASSGDDDVLSFGAKYEADLDGITFAGSFGYGTYQTTDDDDVATDTSVWGIGVNLGFGDTTLYGRWQETETDEEGEANKPEQEIASLAISHGIGPITLALGWVQATRSSYNTGHNTVNDEGVALFAAPEGTAAELQQENEDTMILGSVDYSLGSGVTVSGFVAWGETEQTGAPHTLRIAAAEIAAVPAVTEDLTADPIVEAAPATDLVPAVTDRLLEAGSAKDTANSESATAFGVALNLAF